MGVLSAAFSRVREKESLKSKAIRFFDKADFSHALLVVNNEFVFHAVGHGVEVIPLSEFLKDRDILVQFDFETTRDQDLKLDGFIHGSKGDEYSQSQLLGIVLAKWFKAEGAFFSNGTDKYICSELVAVTFAYIFGKFKDLNKDLVTPRELHDLFVSEALGL